MKTAFAPASVSNLNCGFDILGLAIDRPGDEITVAFNEEKVIRIVSIKGDNGKLPYATEKNTAGVAVQSLFQHLGEKRGVDISIHKKMPFGSGLGSSAASAVGAVLAANALLDNPLSKKELIPFAIDGEVIASGSRHGDNIVPSLLGGFVLVRSEHDIVELPVPKSMYCTVVHPKVEILTKTARDILPKEVIMSDAIHQSANMGSFVAALYQDDMELLARSMEDYLATPYRKSLMPEFDRVKKAAQYGGAVAFGISGAGPSMFALVIGQSRATQVGELMQKALSSKDIDSTLFVSKVNEQGARIL